MKKNVGVVTKDPVLYNKIRLLLRNEASVIRADGIDSDSLDLILVDLRYFKGEIKDAVTIGEGGNLPLSFRHEDVLDLLKNSEKISEAISLSKSTHAAYLSGRCIKLTEVEYKLLEVILSANGYVSKRELLSTVWGDGYDEGVVNVYVHYLRKKLEKDGKKIIISSRNEGYKIDEKYRRGE